MVPRLALVLVLLSGTVAAAPPRGVSQKQTPAGSRRRVAIPVVAADAASAARQLLRYPRDLVVTQVRESLTGEHVRFAQLAPDGTPIADAEVAVHFEGQAPLFEAHLVEERALRPVALAGRRRVSRAAAEAAALAAAGPAAFLRVVGSEAFSFPVVGVFVQPGWRVIVRTDGPTHQWEVWVDGETGRATIRRDRMFTVDGTGMVYRPNPLTTTGDTSLADDDDLDSPALTALRRLVTLHNLDGTGVLRGAWADVRQKSGARATVDPSTLVFDFTRSDDRFEEVNAYYHIDRGQENLRALGFTGARSILARPFPVYVNFPSVDDQSFFFADPPRIELGDGGVDDGEDGDVALHEYGHAVQEDIVPGYGGGRDAASIGEGFGDLMAALTPTEDLALVERACIAPWDATSYTDPPPPIGCLRRTDNATRHYPEHLMEEIHADGALWSGALWNAFTDIGLRTDLDPSRMLRIVVEANFLYGAGVTMNESAEALVWVTSQLEGPKAAAGLSRRLIWRGLLTERAAPDPFLGPATWFPIDIQSAHPLGDSVDQMETITLPGATAIRVHFASIDMEMHQDCLEGICDAIYLYDGGGRLYARLGGRSGPKNSVAVPGDTVLVRWITDDSVASQGFVIDHYEVVGMGNWDGGMPVPDASIIDAGPGGGDPDCGCRVGGSGAGDHWALVFLAVVVAFGMWRRWRHV